MAVDLGSTSFSGCFGPLGDTSQTEGPALVNVVKIRLFLKSAVEEVKKLSVLSLYDLVLLLGKCAFPGVWYAPLRRSCSIDADFR